ALPIFDLLGVQQQLAGTGGFGADVRRGGRQRAYVHADDEELAVANDDVGFLELHVTGTDGLDLPALEHQPGLEPLLDEIVVCGFAVLDDAHERVFLQTVKSEHSILSEPVSMHTVQRSVLVPYTSKQMIDLVADVGRYPEFMPWCGGTQVHRHDESGMEASVTIKIGRASCR